MPSPSDVFAHRERAIARIRCAKTGIGLLGLVIFVLAFPPDAEAVERSASNVVLVDGGAVISDDLYAAGNRVVIQGEVDGDLVVAASEDVTISGTVTGDVMGVAGRVVITGTVGESVRVAAPTIQISGDVGGAVVVVGWNTEIAGTVADDAVIWGWRTALSGSVGGNLEGQTRHTILGGTVEGDVDITVTDLTVTEGARVGQDLGYRSANTATGVDQAEVGGTVVHRRPLAPNVRVRALVVLAKVVFSLLAAVAGLLLIWAAPEASERASASVAGSWGKAWLRGAAVLASPLLLVALAILVALLAPADAVLPLILVLIPFFLAVLGILAALGFAAPVAAYPWMGRAGKSERSMVRAFLYAAAGVTLAVLIPWVWWLVPLVVVPIGIGGWVGPTAT